MPCRGVLRDELLVHQRARKPDSGCLAQFQLARDLADTKAASGLVPRKQFQDAQTTAERLRSCRFAVGLYAL